MLAQFLKKYPEVVFIVKLTFLFSVFYFGTDFWIGITAKGNYYSSFCDEYLNYVRWIRISILKAAGVICSVFGYHTRIENTISLRIINGIKINMVYSCIGIGVLSSWASFVIAYPSKLKRKIYWLFGGLLLIWMVNVIRIAALLILFNKTRDINTFPNHHTAFNIIAYIIVLLLIYFYTKDKKQLAPIT